MPGASPQTGPGVSRKGTWSRAPRLRRPLLTWLTCTLIEGGTWMLSRSTSDRSRSGKKRLAPTNQDVGIFTKWSSAIYQLQSHVADADCFISRHSR